MQGRIFFRGGKIIFPDFFSPTWNKKKKEKKKRNVSSFCNFSAFHFQCTFPFSIFLLINFFPCVFFPGKAAEISRSEVWGALYSPAPPPACYATVLMDWNGSQHWKTKKLLSHPMPPKFWTKMRSLTSVGPYIFSSFSLTWCPWVRKPAVVAPEFFFFFFFFFCGGHRGGKMWFWGGKNPKICRKWLILAIFFFWLGGQAGGQSFWRGGANAPMPPWCRPWKPVTLHLYRIDFRWEPPSPCYSDPVQEYQKTDLIRRSMTPVQTNRRTKN